MTPLRRRMIEDMTLRNLAPRTIQIYIERVATFARHFRTSPERLGPEHIRGYLLHLIQERHVSWSYYNQARSALQFLYRITLGRDWVVDDVVCPKQPRKLPVVLSLEEVARFLAGDHPRQASGPPHDRLCRRIAGLGGRPASRRRHRQSADGPSHPPGQGAEGSLRRPLAAAS